MNLRISIGDVKVVLDVVPSILVECRCLSDGLILLGEWFFHDHRDVRQRSSVREMIIESHAMFSVCQSRSEIQHVGIRTELILVEHVIPIFA